MEVFEMEEGRREPSVSHRYWSWIWAEINQAYPIDCLAWMASFRIGKIAFIGFGLIYAVMTIIIVIHYKPVARFLC